MIKIILFLFSLALGCALFGLFYQRFRKRAAWLLAACVAVALGAGIYVRAFGLGALINPGPPVKGQSAAQVGVKVTVVARDLNTPWAVAFLPDGRYLVTERDGLLKLLRRDGSLQRAVPGVPKVFAEGQGGLLDVALHPDFARNRKLYLSFSEPDTANPKSAGTAVAMARFENDRLNDVKIIFRQQPKVESDKHWGSRLLFKPVPGDANRWYLFITLGERFSQRDKAQTLDNHFGKLIRLFDDGSVPPDNPFVGRKGALPEIWSYGHRNSQGAALLADGTLLTHEHGPKGGDELNAPQPGRNYGWPVITYGEEYTGGPVGKGLKAAPGMEQPLYTWVPSIAPSGMVQLTSDVYPAWKGNLFIGALAHRQLVRLELNGLKVVKEHRLLGEMEERIRDVRQGPDGKLYLLTDSERGQLLRLDPK